MKSPLPDAAELRRLIKLHGSYRAVGLALGIEPKRVEYRARQLAIPSPRSRVHLLVCIFCGMVGNERRRVRRYHLLHSQHQARRRAGSLVICDDCHARKVTPRRAYPVVVQSTPESATAG